MFYFSCTRNTDKQNREAIWCLFTFILGLFNEEFNISGIHWIVVWVGCRDYMGDLVERKPFGPPEICIICLGVQPESFSCWLTLLLVGCANNEPTSQTTNQSTKLTTRSRLSWKADSPSANREFPFFLSYSDFFHPLIEVKRFIVESDNNEWHTSHSVELLWKRDQLDAQTSTGTTQNTLQETSVPPTGFETAILTIERPLTPRLRPLCHWDQPIILQYVT